MAYLYDPNDAHINQPLTNIAIAYRNNETIWRDVAPPVPVTKISDFYYVWDDGTWYRVTADQLSPTGIPNTILKKFSSAPYSCIPYGLMDEVAVATIENADDPLDPLGKGVEIVKNQLELQQEIRVAALAFTAANYAAGFKATLSGANQWSDATSKPVKVITKALDIPLQRPNTLVFSAETFSDFQTNPEVIAAVTRLGGNAAQGGRVNALDIQALFADDGITKVVVGRARVDSSNMGQTAGTPTYIWGKHAAAIYVNPSPRIDDASFAYTFISLQAAITRNLVPMAGSRGVEQVKVAWELDSRQTAQKSGYFWENAVA